jgi:uncharacterized protein YbbK (DUF523 family)
VELVSRVSGWGHSRSNRPRVGISRCLLGGEVRYDGGHKRDALLVSLAHEVEWVPVCPEVEVGMGVPREPIQLRQAESGVRLVGVETAFDWTERMESWARRRIDELMTWNLAGFVLKARSPSCGVRDVAVYGRHAVAGGRGMFADLLLGTLPDLPVTDEEDLHDPHRRAAFLTQVRQYSR